MYVGYAPTSSRYIKDTIYGCILRDAQREAQAKKVKPVNTDTKTMRLTRDQFHKLCANAKKGEKSGKQL